jgi:thiol-disulfide isomerase/thioredoxin
MIIIHADTEAKVNEINHHVENGKDVFILVYMNGCGPCNATRPEWTKLEEALQEQYKHNNNLVIADIESNFVSSLKHAGDIIGYPTMLYLSNNGNKMELYEDSSIREKKREVDNFINWVESHVGTISISGSKSKSRTRKASYNKHYTTKTKSIRSLKYSNSKSKVRSRSRTRSRSRSRSRSIGGKR